MEVNGLSFRSVAHDEAVQILKSSRHMLMTIKDVGRLPHARTVVDETKWISSPQIAESSAGAALRSADQELLLLFSKVQSTTHPLLISSHPFPVL